ncbi:Rossmann-like and DUF2520 domain-containing protein [Desertivirga arenae]|uniref:Rossmann-like and DUF2520 domain-containing protein n=1 Tax=Desertivirga arenae TaxID=2810309 RepID=UPI001A976BD5|nr:Rossmann-like and DUF2520 domain-containing protein [Pedobacter sp. SYSU D00823]
MKITLLGSGNVATHLGKALQEKGHTIVQVWSRSIENAIELATQLLAEGVNTFEAILPDADVYIIAVSDTAIGDIAKAFPFRDKLLVHTSGTTGLEVLESASERIGVFYPLQTFSKQRPLNFKIIPIAIEARDIQIENVLRDLASSISETTVVFDSQKRKALHVAAVFACNFSNHLYSIADGILKDSGLDFSLLRPLIEETASKVQSFFPHEVQTGPAVRNDQMTINKHVEFFKERPELEEIYRLISQNIINFYQKA